MSLEKFVKEHRAAFDNKKMPDSATIDFEARLKRELHNPRVKKLKVIRSLSIAASFLVLLTLGYIFNEHKNKELEIRDSLVLALNQSETNSERLQNIYEIQDEYQNKKEDKKILNAFFKILKEDSDTNSKIAVIDALLKFPNSQEVRDNLIEALGNEKEPLVQLKLIKSVAILRENRAKSNLKQLIEDEESLPLVKGNASALLAMLNQ